ncbi:mannosyl-3-phosphoglycerate phosphatase-related protein [Erwinia sp. E602]|uniref:mannosyl-3-phosphoglycerate phosphatase-related protein n=1 Tax=Erwinia sp. E602 TaxID=2675378 RepID=UPI001BAD59C6|nr:mannosyl-3-phosphoglycerate phosphatase-related protein [Erwinia sp. E602]QUG76270.1 mannosyl-3-phosphoglycerate phosphatase-related protein [Erwinia sp. E602]
MPTLQDPLTIVTDLDGSLLDHHTYSWQPAQAWLDRLQEARIPIVICSSKTATEIVPLQRALGLGSAPFISENGALVQWDGAPGGPLRHHPGPDYASLCHTLLRLRQREGFKFTGFSDVTEKEIADWTGLSPGDAALAKMREASESLIWRDDDARFALFGQRLAEEGLALVQGGRFWHVMPQGRDKGSALRWLLQETPFGAAAPLTIGLGDSPNDAPMLDSVDFAVVIKGFSKNPLLLQRAANPAVYRTAHAGPQGWSEGLDFFITQT